MFRLWSIFSHWCQISCDRTFLLLARMWTVAPLISLCHVWQFSVLIVCNIYEHPLCWNDDLCIRIIGKEKQQRFINVILIKKKSTVFNKTLCSYITSRNGGHRELLRVSRKIRQITYVKFRTPIIQKNSLFLTTLTIKEFPMVRYTDLLWRGHNVRVH